jgi:hypothetical protein
MKKNIFSSLGLIIVLSGFLFLGGCAGSRTYLLHLSYDASPTTPFLKGAPQPVTVAVYQFLDVRPERLYLGRRVYRDGMIDYYKPDNGTVEQVVTESIVRIMEKAGFKVTRVNRVLNTEKEDFKNIPGNVALGGKIEALWVEAKTGYVTTDAKARISLKYFWGLVKDQTWETKTIEGSAEKTDQPLFKPEDAEKLINDVLKDGLDKLLKDESLLREKLLKQK